jgi:ligand-binding sensor domain-containing protein/signal transduction histidine kinase
MGMRLPFSICLFIGFLCFHSISFSQDIHFDLVTRAPGDEGTTVIGMTQDAQGFLWLATDLGLYKYDGYQYSSYHHHSRNSNSPAADNIVSVTSDNAGYLWLAPLGSGLDRLDPATGVFTHFRHHKNDPGSLANDTVNILLQDHEGSLWVGSNAGIDKFDPKTNKFFHYTHHANDPSSLSCNYVKAIYEDRERTIWVGTGTAFSDHPAQSGGLNKLEKKTGKFTRYLHDAKDPNSLIDNRVQAIFEDSRGDFWIGTAGDGLHTMDRTRGIFERHLHDSLHPDKLSRPPVKNVIVDGQVDHITFITEDNRHRIWIGTYEGGINVYDPTTLKVSSNGSGENSDLRSVLVSYKTRDNTLWISTWENNLYKVDPYQKPLPHTRIGRTVYCFAEDDAHDLWIGTKHGLIHRENNGKDVQFLIDKDSTSQLNQINNIEKDDNKFWVTTVYGMYLFDPITKTFSGYYHQANNPKSLSANPVWMVKMDTDNKLWISTTNGLDQLDIKSGTFRHFQNSSEDTESISNNMPLPITIDRKENLWVGTVSGLNRFNKETGKFKRYLNQLLILSIVEDRAGDLWVGTVKGLFKYHKEADNFLIFADKSSLITPSLIGGITEDHLQNLWFGSVGGIMNLNKERTGAVLYGKRQGVEISAIRSSGFTRQNGEVLIGDTSGYFDFRPELLQQDGSPPPPIVMISNFLLNNISIPAYTNGIFSTAFIQTKGIRLNHDQNTISFEFKNIDFSSDHEDTRLLYMLQNYDNTWRNAGAEKTAYYFNLPPGKYIFKVKAVNYFGLTDEKVIPVIITPPWWSTWWAYTIFVLLGAGLVWAFIAYRSRRLNQENKVLEEKVEHRTTQLNQSLQNLKATQTQLVQSEKMASLGELTAGIAHEIQNPLNFMNNFSEVNKELVEELKYEIDKGNFQEVKLIADDIGKNEEKISHHGKRADAIVKGMLQHSRISAGQKEATGINALADEYLRLSYHGLRARDKSFNANMHTDFDPASSDVNVISQDIGRVLLNLYNNAFYAVAEKKKQQPEGYEPVVSVTTKRIGDKVLISVKDNGNGIPQKVLDKIFLPFFTTKPTGQGTGLGLSMSYDIVKAHGGELKVGTNGDGGAEFLILIPAV